jgi:protein-L-isoaspartate(D-aspartate) O-methyltransferase
MVEEQLVPRGIRDARVLQVMTEVPRHYFVDSALASQAYSDNALPIGERQTLSQPYIVARMLQLLELRGGEAVLEIGTGTGYQTALLARLAAKVYSVERLPSLVRKAAQRLQGMGARNVAFRHGDGSLGWPEFAPYDRVLVSAGAPRVPDALRQQLATGGILVIPVGDASVQRLEVWRRHEPDRWTTERHGDCRFVPLVGRDAWEKPPAE